MIEMKDIEKYYKSGSLKSYVLRHVHLDIAEGEFVSIMGPSGAGKSTLMHIMGMLDEPTGNLNSRQGEEVMELLKELNAEGTTIVQVTHSEKNAAYGSRIVHLLDGKVMSTETAA